MGPLIQFKSLLFFPLSALCAHSKSDCEQIVALIWFGGPNADFTVEIGKFLSYMWFNTYAILFIFYCGFILSIYNFQTKNIPKSKFMVKIYFFPQMFLFWFLISYTVSIKDVSCSATHKSLYDLYIWFDNTHRNY